MTDGMAAARPTSATNELPGDPRARDCRMALLEPSPKRRVRPAEALSPEVSGLQGFGAFTKNAIAKAGEVGAKACKT